MTQQEIKVEVTPLPGTALQLKISTANTPSTPITGLVELAQSTLNAWKQVELANIESRSESNVRMEKRLSK